MTPTAMPSVARASAAFKASNTVTPAATIVAASLALCRSVFDPPISKTSDGPYSTSVFGREVRM